VFYLSVAYTAKSKMESGLKGNLSLYKYFSSSENSMKTTYGNLFRQNAKELR
jgi:hypothetical protein